MQNYERFVFDSVFLNKNTRTIELNYSFDDAVHFTERIKLAGDAPLDRADSPGVQRALFALHLAGGASYYKAALPKIIEVRSGELNPDQADFWNEFYTKGLGEFFYRNKIDFRGLVRFPAAKDAPTAIVREPLRGPKNALVPFGGGKDSQVTVEMLRRHDIGITLFRMQGHQFITELAELNRLPLLEVSRSLDPRLFELNKQGALNGHVPITGYVTFLTLTIALLYGFDSVFFSNERSSDYGNVEYLGMQVNHQWSKSNEAELMITNYIEHYITHETRYLNALRPLSELHIAKIFSREPKYFKHVTSCNRNWLWQKLDENPDQGRWCGECDKCTFVFAMFAAFLPLGTLQDMFKKNLFDDEALLGSYRQLWGIEEFKPFECVGTPEEAKAALYLATRRDEYADTSVGREFIAKVLPTIKDPEGLVKTSLTPDYSDVSPYITAMIKEELHREDNRA
jgi:UDP-N-acetyl-alpha-D-muramoyl-L-alanyl-L-glutamate epimerase